MAESAAPKKPGQAYLWWLVLGRAGLDYFSILAYAVGQRPHVAPARQ